MFAEPINKKIQSIDKTNLLGISLMGSYSRGEASRFSDIDIVCFSEKEREMEVLIVAEKYMVISFVTKSEVEKWFTNPELSATLLYGVTKLIPIWETNNYLTNLKIRASAFEWNDEMQTAIDKYVNRELVLLIEEVNKGIQGLISQDKGRMLNCIFGLSHLLATIVCVKKKIFIISDNSIYEQVLSSYSKKPKIVELLKMVFGEIPLDLAERTKAGLKLFKKISTEFKGGMDTETIKMIKITTNSINLYFARGKN